MEEQVIKTDTGVIKAQYMKLSQTRSAILERARECAALTIPSLLPPEGNTETMTLPTPYQSLGARGVNNLASKLLLALLPPNQAFFRLVISDKVLADLQVLNQKTEIEKKLNQMEREIMTWIETNALRVSSFEALKLLIVTGNALEYLPDEGGMKVYKLDQYVIKRDPMGNVLEIIIQEKIHPEVLPQEIQQAIKTSETYTNEKSVELYTWVRRENNLWKVSQEAAGIPIPSSEGSYPIDDCPWIPLRWTAVNGEDYGRGFVEEYLGDFRFLDGVMAALYKFAAAASKIVFLVDPNGTTDVRDLANAKSGDFKKGRADDISVLQVEKYYDYQVANDIRRDVEQRLSQAFLLMSSFQRDAERVTAEEIRQMAKELEDSLGGVYSVLSQEKQLPLIRRVMSQMRKQGRLPLLPKEVVEPMIVTGLEALGRGHDLNKLQIFKEFIRDIPNASERLKAVTFMERAGTALGIDTNGLFMTDEEWADAMNQAQMAQLAQGALPGVAQEVTKGIMGSAQATPEAG